MIQLSSTRPDLGPRYYAFPRTSEELALHLRAAEGLAGISMAVVAYGTDEASITAAGDAYAEFALQRSQQQGGSTAETSGGQQVPVNDPETYRGTAEKIVRDGGAMVAITVSPPANSTSPFYARLEELRSAAGVGAES